ncbi:MAG: hemerythrin domain-containing protein [Jatrophihabitantaceae bacterium]
MSESTQGNVESQQAQDARTASLKDEHALLMREVTTRAHAVTSAADEGRWPETQLRELLNYLHLEVLRQVVEEEWLLFRVVRHATEDLARLRREHLELRLSIEVLDQAAATGGTPGGLSPAQLSATTQDLVAQLAEHMTAEDELAIAGETAPAITSFGAQPHEWYALLESPVIDLDQLQGKQGADAALGRLLRLKRSEQVEIRSAVDPSPMWQRLSAADPGGYGIAYLERGPQHWRVQITRRGAHSTLQPYA